MLSDEDLRRYSRQFRLPQLGIEGQERLRDSRALLLGLGGLGSPAALYLAAAGVGTLGLAEYDTVEIHNLQRQVLFRESDAGNPKLEAAKAALLALNSRIHCRAHPGGLTPRNAITLFREYDIVLDGSDNFATRYLANDAAHLAGRPLIHASVSQFRAQLTVFDTARGGPCLRCLFPGMPSPESAPPCGEAGVLGALCGVAGSWMAAEAVKILAGFGKPLRGRLLLLDLLEGGARAIRLGRTPDCALCGKNPTIHEILPENYARGACAHPAAREAAQDTGPGDEIDAGEAMLRAASATPPFIIDVREPDELPLGSIPGCVNIPLSLLSARAGILPSDCDILVVCQSGMRSQRAVRILREHGFARAWSIRGGMNAWKTRTGKPPQTH
ncbi:MAG: ThiF family adenylyltransferase [Puniceicoccales bacterium]|jgi:adenylyltransferase/sulfurtransferase|nr:ThiF family adenylyltransferase [Puniceicoccales bacterium]